MAKFLYPEVVSEVREHFTHQEAEEFLAKNSTNRPRSSSLTNRYMWKYIRRRWVLNGEPIIVSRTGKLLSGQHRCYALVQLEARRAKRPKYFAEKFGIKKPVTIPTVIVYGIHDDYANTLDQGKTRTHSDILFRMSLFDSYVDGSNKERFTLSDKKTLARDLATAVRTVWLRMENKRVKDAPKFDEAEMIDFLAEHPKLIDAVVHTFDEDAGKEKRSSSLVSRAYLAAVMYLAGTSSTDRLLWERGEAQLDYENWSVAEDFVVNFSQGANLDDGDPALILRRAFDRHKAAGTTRDRDVTLNTLIKAFDAAIEEQIGLTLKDLTPSKTEVPRLGGLDVELDIVEEVVEEEEPVQEAEAVEEAPKPRKRPTKKAKKRPAKKRQTVPPEEPEEEEEQPEDE